jgi:hypothetical protein
MPRLVGVSKNDWDWFVSFAQERFAGSGTTENARLVRLALVALDEMLDDAERDGRALETEDAVAAQRAGRLLDAFEKAGSELAVKAVMKQDVCSIAVGWNGSATVTTMPTYYGVRRRDPATGERLKQSELLRFFELSWPEFERLITSLSRQSQVLDERVRALSELLPLRTKYPESTTPLDAMESAGIDPYHFAWQE